MTFMLLTLKYFFKKLNSVFLLTRKGNCALNFGSSEMILFFLLALFSFFYSHSCTYIFTTISFWSKIKKVLESIYYKDFTEVL